MNTKRLNDSTLWKVLADVAVELIRRGDVVMRETKQGPEATISVMLEPGWGKAPALVALGNATLNPRFVHHLTAFPIHPATVAAINKNAYREPRARA
jgi:hypothetical protein